MSQLYKVEIDRKKIISSYNDKGRLVGERLETIRESYRDLPAATAQSYRELFPDARVVITPEVQDRAPARRRNVEFADTRHVPSQRPEPYRAEKRKVEEKPTPAPASYADVVNAMLEKD